MQENSYYLNTDGGSRGNPGPGAIAYVISRGTEIVLEGGDYIGVSTNNEAEYLALLAGLEQVLQLNIKKIVCKLDSELVVKQLNGLYRVKDSKMKSLYEKIRLVAGNFDSISYVHIPRNLNKAADAMVNRVLDQRENAKIRKF